MDTTRFFAANDSENHREVSAAPTGHNLTANVMSNPAPPRQQIESRAKQRCFYGAFTVLLLSVLIANLSSFTFFIVIDVEIQSNGSFWETCILFVNEKDLSAGAWSCDAVLGIKVLVMLLTIVMVGLHFVLLCRGDPM